MKHHGKQINNEKDSDEETTRTRQKQRIAAPREVKQNKLMIHVMRKPTFWFLTWSDTNQVVGQGLEISDLERRGIVLSI